VVKATPTDGQFVTLRVGQFAAAVRRSDDAGRKLLARVDLSDDRSFLSERHRDLVDMVAGLSVRRGEMAGQGWVWIAADHSVCEIHVVLARLPPSIDLMLGRCALELVGAAAVDGARPDLDGRHMADCAGNVIDLEAVREARGLVD
jgi:hypothetical protein